MHGSWRTPRCVSWDTQSTQVLLAYLWSVFFHNHQVREAHQPVVTLVNGFFTGIKRDHRKPRSQRHQGDTSTAKSYRSRSAAFGSPWRKYTSPSRNGMGQTTPAKCPETVSITDPLVLAYVWAVIPRLQPGERLFHASAQAFFWYTWLAFQHSGGKPHTAPYSLRRGGATEHYM